MTTLLDLLPTAEDVLALTPADLAPCLLLLAKENRQRGMFQPDAVPTLQTATGVAPPRQLYPVHRRDELELAISAGWQWLRNQNLIAPSPGINGKNGWTVVTAEGERINSADDHARFRAAAAFPKELLHPSVAESVHGELMRGRYDAAVLDAFRAVEIAVREAGGFSASDVGVELMRKAFASSGGPLTDMSLPPPEREAMAHLFAGAIGAFKNPHSHRRVNISDVRVAQDQALLASHLLRIVDSRRRP